MWYAIVLAGGSGSRMGAGCNKVFLSLGGVPAIVRSVRAVGAHAEGTVVVCRACDIPEMRQLLKEAGLDAVIVPGGETRQDSVWQGLCALPDGCTRVLIHDGARCMVDDETILRCKASVDECGTGVAAIPVVDTIKIVDEQEYALSTPAREALRAVQTPQAFRVDLIREAHLQARKSGFIGTDDASLVEAMGHSVRMTLGARTNLKLTTPEDMKMANAFLPQDFPALRIGQGYDVHRLVEGRPLILCGVEVPHTLGLLGHSDADVALHALMDAMLGACALGDIGRHFPDTDERYRGISSMTLLEHVVALLASRGARVTNCDVTIVAQKPRLLPHISQMRANVAQALNLPVERVNVKATTTERLAFEGREEGISAQAVCMVEMR